MLRTLNDLASDLYGLAEKLPAAPSELAKKVALTIVADLSYHTPVDTSKALSNWVIGIGSKPDLTIPPYFPGEGGSTQKASAQATIEAAKVALKNKKPGQSIWISNALPYIKRLNDGYSKQAPAGFVERSILIARKVIEKS